MLKQEQTHVEAECEKLDEKIIESNQQIEQCKIELAESIKERAEDEIELDKIKTEYYDEMNQLMYVSIFIEMVSVLILKKL